MYMPVDKNGDWITISILNCDTLCAFQSAGEVMETAEMFQPGIHVQAMAIDLETWAQTLTDAMTAGVRYAVEFLVFGSPRVKPIEEMLEDVRVRLVRHLQYALRRPRELSRMR